MKKLLAITWILCLTSSVLQAQDNLKVELKDGPKPDIYIDGKKYDYAIFELLDQSKIESVDVIKGDQAIKEYNAPNGVVIIKTNKSSQSVEKELEKEIKIRSSNDDKDPVIIIDGKVSNKQKLSKISPDDIKTIEVLKGEQAIEEYDAPDGVIIVKTKK